MAYEVSEREDGFWDVAGLPGYYASEQVANQVRANMLAAPGQTADFYGIDDDGGGGGGGSGGVVRTSRLEVRYQSTDVVIPAVKWRTDGPSTGYPHSDLRSIGSWSHSGFGADTTVTADSNRTFAAEMSADPSEVNLGDRVLWRGDPGNEDSDPLIERRGIYTIIALGEDDESPWVLQRAADFSDINAVYELTGAAVHVDTTGDDFLLAEVSVGTSFDDFEGSSVLFLNPETGPTMTPDGRLHNLVSINNTPIEDLINDEGGGGGGGGGTRGADITLDTENSEPLVLPDDTSDLFVVNEGTADTIWGINPGTRTPGKWLTLIVADSIAVNSGAAGPNSIVMKEASGLAATSLGGYNSITLRYLGTNGVGSQTGWHEISRSVNFSDS